MYFYTSSHFFLFFTSKYYSQHFALRQSQSTVLLYKESWVRVSHPYKTKIKIIVVTHLFADVQKKRNVESSK
jgi:hypothetical protein